MVTWSADVVADDWKHITASEVVSRSLARLEAKGKGILLLHDIQPATALAMPHLLRELKRRGYKIVQVAPASAPALVAGKQRQPARNPQRWLRPRRPHRDHRRSRNSRRARRRRGQRRTRRNRSPPVCHRTARAARPRGDDKPRGARAAAPRTASNGCRTRRRAGRDPRGRCMRRRSPRTADEAPRPATPQAAACRSKSLWRVR